MDEEYRMNNREKVLQPKKGKYWCDRCDTQLVDGWKKCPVCGGRSGRRRLAKRDV